MILYLYCCENGTENHNLWQRRRCILNAMSMILADAYRDFRLGNKFFYSDLQLWQIQRFNEIKIATHLTFILWFKSCVMCLELMIFKDQTVCQGWGLPVSGTGLPKVGSQEDFLFNRISNILELIVYIIKKYQTRQKLIGKLDTVSAEILS